MFTVHMLVFHAVLSRCKHEIMRVIFQGVMALSLASVLVMSPSIKEKMTLLWQQIPEFEPPPLNACKRIPQSFTLFVQVQAQLWR